MNPKTTAGVWPEAKRENWKKSQELLRMIDSVKGFLGVFPIAMDLIEQSGSRVGHVLRNNGRVPFPVMAGSKAFPKDCISAYPVDNLFPLPIPEPPPLCKKGRGRERSHRRACE